MKSKLILLLAVVAVFLSGVCVFLARRSAQQQAQVQTLRRELEQKEQQVHDLELAKDRLNQQGRELLLQAQERAIEASRQPPAAALPGRAPQSAVPGQNAGDQPASERGGLGGMLAQMMRDPETRKLIQQQQRLMMDQLYGPLIKQLGLRPEEADKLKELLAEHAGKATERATSLLGGTSATNRTEMLGAMAAQNQAHEDQLKELLGETRYAQYKDYQQTVGERMQLNLFKQQSAPETALTDQQTEQLLAFMKEEKQNLAAVGLTVPPSGSTSADNLQAVLAEDQSEQMLQNQESINQRVFERAKAVLAPEQLDSFGKFQTNQLQMMRMGITMARKLLAPQETPAAAPAP